MRGWDQLTSTEQHHLDLSRAEQLVWNAAASEQECNLREPGMGSARMDSEISSDPVVRAFVLHRLIADERVHVDLTGAVIKGELDLSSTTVGPITFTECHFVDLVRFDGATLDRKVLFTRSKLDRISFEGAHFKEEASFHEATIGHMDFSGAQFDDRAYFTKAVFTADAEFHKARFTNDAYFSAAQFENDAFFDCTFARSAHFDNAVFDQISHITALFNGHHTFENTRFENDAYFDRSIFRLATKFDRAIFSADADFSQCTFIFGCRFTETTFNRLDLSLCFAASVELSQCTIEKSLRTDGTVTPRVILDHSRIESAGVPLHLTTRHLSAVQTNFVGTNRLVLICGTADFTGADFGDHCVVEQGDPDQPTTSGANPLSLTYPPSHTFDDVSKNDRAQWLPADQRAHLPDLLTRLSQEFDETRSVLLKGHPTRIQSLQRANVAGLSLFRVSLTECRMTTARNLDQIRIDNTDVFGTSRHDLAPHTDKCLPSRLWTRRAVLFEEQAARRGNDPITLQERCAPHLVAAAYRELRKSLEDSKDEPGAADFYYGEMEMRRRGSPKLSVERGLLTLYWLVAGYGLRAWRTLATLSTLLLVVALVYTNHDFAMTVSPPPRSLNFWEALTFTVRDATVLLRPPGAAAVTTQGVGTVLDVLIRIATPVLLALTALAIRARVKR